MTATVSTAPDVIGALKRADSRFNRRTGDDPAPAEYIDALAHAVQTLLGKDPSGATVPDDELADLRHQNGRLVDEVERLTRAASAHEAAVTSTQTDLVKHQRLIEERDRRVHELSDRVQELLDALEAAQRAAVRVPAAPHRHQYPWAAPGTYPTPCACGQPYPRTNIAAVPAPKAAEPEPFAALFSRVRGQLAGWPVAS